MNLNNGIYWNGTTVLAIAVLLGKGRSSIYSILFLFIAIASAIILLSLNVNAVLAFFITVLLLLACDIIIVVIRNARFKKVLDWDCDPEKYLGMIDRQESKYRRNSRAAAILDINRAAAYLIMGDYNKALEYLNSIEESELSEKNDSCYVYTINRILCYYELGETEKAEALYETELVRLCPYGNRLKTSVEILVGERYFFLHKYKESYAYLKKLLSTDLHKRQYLGVLYRLALMDDINGEQEQARAKYKKIAKLGNKLWIAKDAGERLKKLEEIA
jgi:tetratricopeptide (TPR) repeat protein